MPLSFGGILLLFLIYWVKGRPASLRLGVRLAGGHVVDWCWLGRDCWGNVWWGFVEWHRAVVGVVAVGVAEGEDWTLMFRKGAHGVERKRGC